MIFSIPLLYLLTGTQTENYVCINKADEKVMNKAFCSMEDVPQPEAKACVNKECLFYE